MKKWFFSIFLIAIFFSAFSQKKYSKIKVYTGVAGIEKLNSCHIAPINGFLKKEGFFVGEFDSENVEKIKQSGMKYEILVDDLQASYPSENIKDEKATLFNACFNRSIDYPQPSGVQFGSMGGFYTFSEAMAELDTMIMLYPNLISSKVQIGSSFQSRQIISVKISDNAAIPEPEPQVLYTAIHHSQEPASLQQLIYYMYYLLENYGTSPEVTYLIDNTELYFIPVVNPDGYVYNESQNPSGGGMQRKNRRTSLFSDGVDLNRNYDWFFGLDEIGSSSIGFHPWHRGDNAFSEPETQAVKGFMESHDIKIDVNWHAYGNMIIYPWNYANEYTDDTLFFEELSASMAYRNNYRYGTVYETYGYQSNGDADDWCYGETTSKIRSISLTAEVGSMDDGFWPDPSAIMSLCNNTIWTNLALAHYAHAYYKMSDRSSFLISQTNGYLKYKFQSVGLDSSASFVLSFIPLTSNIQFPAGLVSYSNMSIMQSVIDSVEYNLTASFGEEFSYIVSVNNGLYSFNDTVTKVYGTTTILVDDNCENLDNWTGDDWNISAQQSYSGAYSISESPVGEYGILQTSNLTLQPTIDLSSAQHAVIQFMTKYSLENNYDYVQVSASIDGGINWQPLCGRIGKLGTDDEDEGQPVYHGILTDWNFEEISLQDYLGEQLKIKISFVSDQSGTREGFYFDDFKVIVMDSLFSFTTQSPQQNNISVFPNPATNSICISNALPDSKIEVCNGLGMKILNGEFADTQLNIDTEHWARGIYFYRITGSNLQRGKFILK